MKKKQKRSEEEQQEEKERKDSKKPEEGRIVSVFLREVRSNQVIFTIRDEKTPSSIPFTASLTHLMSVFVSATALTKALVR